MSAITMQPASRMGFFEAHVNAPESACPAPTYPGEPMRFRLPTAGLDAVNVIFVAYQHSTMGLRWRYHGTEVERCVE